MKMTCKICTAAGRRDLLFRRRISQRMPDDFKNAVAEHCGRTKAEALRFPQKKERLRMDLFLPMAG